MSYIDISKLDRLFDECTESIVIMHESGQIQKMNQEAAQLLGRNHLVNEQLMLDEMSSDRWDAFMKDVTFLGVAYCNVNMMVHTNNTATNVFGCYLKEEKSVLLWITPSSNEDKLINTDMLCTIMDCACYDAILSDKHGSVLEMTQGACTILQNKMENVSQQTYTQLLYNLDFSQEQILKHIQQLDEHSISTSDFKMPIDDETVIYEMTAIRIHANNLLITLFKDVTVERSVAGVKEEKVLSNLNELVATIVHEIRNPMTSLKGFLDLLKLNMRDDGQQYFSIIDAEFERLELILEDFLYLSKPPKYNMEKVSFVEMIEQVVDLMQPQAIQNNILLMLEYCVHDEFTIHGNVVRLKQLLINVIKNAIEVMPLGGTITIALSYNLEQNMELIIKDEGYGMNEKTMQGLFTPFFTTKNQGSGLGLPLVKKIIEEHGGEVKVWSKEGVGTEFTFTIPVTSYEHLMNIPLDESVSLT